MNGFDYHAGKAFSAKLPALSGDSLFSAICTPDDVQRMMGAFGWDKGTVDECTNLDETIRYTCYDGYDFVSLLYAETESNSVSQCEINLILSKNYLVLVLPETPSQRLAALLDKMSAAMQGAAGRPSPLTYIYYLVFDSLTSDYSDTLEALEDDMEALSEAIESKPCKEQSVEIARLRKTAYTYKKLLRALSYIGTQLLMDENDLLHDAHFKYFSNISTRLVKLYDFADTLYGLSNELLHTYDSKFSAQMNETINKLTSITLFFGPLTVIAGIYGMNFVHMPELEWPFGYPAALGLMAAICIVAFVVMKKKKWM